jgi:hypothetical protein
MDESGQAVTEYILMLFAVIGFYLITASFIAKFGLAAKITAPITQGFAQTYQFGKPDVLGFVDGGPKDHPRMALPGNNRLFINPVRDQAGGE